MTALVIAAPGAEACAARLADRLGWAGCRLESRQFPDGETYLRVADDVAGCDLAVVAQLRDPDPQLPRLLFLADALRELGARRVGLVAPYLPYMRQDKRFHPGEAVTSRSVARWIAGGFDWLATLEPHLHRVAALGELYPIPTASVASAGPIAQWVREQVPHPHIVGPDEESAPWVAEVAAQAGCGHSVLTKTRRGDRTVEIAAPDLSGLHGCTPVLVDDIVSTAHTMAQAVRLLRAAGLPAPVCVGVHALFVDGAEALLRDAGAARIVSCNTLPHPSNAIDVTAVLAEATRALTRSPENSLAARAH